MPLETLEDLDTFFEIDDGPAIRALITGPATTPANHQFARTLPVIFDEGSEAVAIYGETDVEAAQSSFACRSLELDGVTRGMKVRFLGLLPGEEGYGKTYEVARWSAAAPGTTRVHLKEL